MKRACITTYFDTAYSELGNLCVESLKRYADIHSMDTKIFRTSMSERPTPWNKILIAKQLFLEKYDYVFWVDADAIIVRFNENILDVVEDGKDLYLVKITLDGQEIPNTGIFLIKNSGWSSQFLCDIWGMNTYVNHKWWENAAIADLLGYKSLLEEDGKNDPHNQLLQKVKWIGNKWNHNPGICESSNPIIKHYAGKPYEQRLNNMQSDWQHVISGKRYARQWSWPDMKFR